MATRPAPVFGISNTTDAAPAPSAKSARLRPAQRVAYTMLGLSSMMLVIGLVTEKRNAAEYNQTKWILDAAMIGWFVMVLSVLRHFVWFPHDPAKAAEAVTPAASTASAAAAAIRSEAHPASNGSSGTDADDEEDEDAIVVRRRRVRRDA